MEKTKKVRLSDFLKTVLKVIKISIETDKRRVIIIFTTTVLMATLGALSFRDFKSRKMRLFFIYK
jgi:hypothetical protein